MAMAMGNLASLIVEFNQSRRLDRVLQPSSPKSRSRSYSQQFESDEDLELLRLLQVSSQKKGVDKNEFLVLSLVRAGVVRIETIMAIMKRFTELDNQGDGSGLVAFEVLMSNGSSCSNSPSWEDGALGEEVSSPVHSHS
jgi:hypothetical protein